MGPLIGISAIKRTFIRFFIETVRKRLSEFQAKSPLGSGNSTLIIRTSTSDFNNTFCITDRSVSRSFFQFKLPIAIVSFKFMINVSCTILSPGFRCGCCCCMTAACDLSVCLSVWSAVARATSIRWQINRWKSMPARPKCPGDTSHPLTQPASPHPLRFFRNKVKDWDGLRNE